MAKQGRMVRVSGLPTDINGDRLTDKLLIHFLRAKNGGGEVDFVTIVKATPASALITFQDSEVARRVVQHSRHVLEVDGKMYKLTAIEHHEGLEPDKVIIGLSATVNCSQLPGGIPALKNLRKSHADVEIYYDAEEFCTLRGAYSKVQAALDQILGHPGGPQSPHRDSGQPDPTCSTESAQPTRTSHNQGSENHSRKPNRQRAQSETARQSSSLRNLMPSGYSGEDSGQAEGAGLWHSGNPTAAEEDFSLILDADMFQYLQKHCWTEYQHILSLYGVEVVDMTNQGLTTLFLQVTAEVREDGQEQERLALAQKALSQLYQENETKIRRATLPKCVLSPTGGLQKAIESLKIRLPKLLLNEDDRNIFIIGSSSDISEAKQLLLLDHDKVNAKKDDVASLLRHTSYDSSSFAPEDKVGATTISSAEGCLNDGLERSDEDERRAEGTRRYKLAARFRESGLAALSDRPTDFTIRGLSSLGRQTVTGPILGHDVFSETAGNPGGRLSTAVPQITGGDILFRSGDSYASMQNKISLNTNLMDTWSKSVTSPLSTAQSSLSGSTAPPPAESGSTVKHDSKSAVRPRGRSSSFSGQTEGRDKKEVYKAEVKVSTVKWVHIKEAYSTRMDDLTSDVKIKENSLEGSSTITIRGANQSRVSSCQLGLQKLVESVSVDFSVQELPLSELGVSDPADETLQVCCAEVRSRYKKVSIKVRKNSLILLGPKQLCSQVRATLQEVFSGDVAQTPKQQDFSVPSTSYWNPPTPLQTNEEQYSFESNSQVMLESQTGPDGGQETGTNHNSDINEKELLNGRENPTFVWKNPVIKEKVKMTGTAEMDGQKDNALTNNATAGSMRHVNGVGSATARTDKAMGLHNKERTLPLNQKDDVQQRKVEIQDNPGESRAGLGEQGYTCVCGDSGTSVTRTKCGATMCSKCLDSVHVHCRVCYAADPTPPGIQGKMSLSKLQFSLTGHSKDPSIKITYYIPDGIQGSDHPFPGNPFQGGLFEAFLPDCTKSRKLLPLLEKAFRQGLTFMVTGTETGATVTWDSIPHKTSLQGGKSGKGYPDSTYLTRLSEVLTSHGIEE
ncbi:uncharacterized protein si:busm1-163l24.3 [Hippoglossus stenolepis]|uniref:uncharacterized protein si:busm1-163l24.3 n=1 Tax=Hippoglossus stenolepis TaxID=195615 RepID=UPI001FAFDD5D|nr:uncharacterized protein si:busm1-163l24.3 [Hippoglossus stenolepis]XP_035035794.2 uncharacterized protein si:busm1-163l24.3 [Hippoglossus stenolepis]